MSDATLAVLVVMLVLAVSCTGEDPPSPRPLPATMPAEWGNPVGGLSCAILLPAARFRPGDPVVLSVAMRNTSDAVQTIWNRGVWPNHRVLVTDAAGAEPPLTDHGRLTREAFGRPEARKTIPIQLQPGEVKLPTAQIDLTTLFQMPAGRYSVVVEYAERDVVGLRSNTLEFEVLTRSAPPSSRE